MGPRAERLERHCLLASGRHAATHGESSTNLLGPLDDFGADATNVTPALEGTDRDRRLGGRLLRHYVIHKLWIAL